MASSVKRITTFFVLYIALLMWLTGKGQATNSFPLNTAVVVGQTVTLNCRTRSHHSVWWRYIPVGSKADSILFNGENLSVNECDSCTINNTEPGQYDLRIANTRQTDAGTYICVEMNETDANVSKVDYHSAELTVLVSVPECGSNLTGSNASLLEDNNSARMWCRVAFRGNIVPTMEWRIEATAEVILSRITNHQNQKIESDIIVQLTHASNRDTAYSCKTYFNQSFYETHASIYSAAKNTPDYKYNWISQNMSCCKRSAAIQENSTEMTYMYPPLVNEPISMSTMMTALVIIISLLIILIFCTIFLKISSKGCFKSVSSVGPNLISHTNTEGISNIFYEDPHAGATSPINGERTNHAIQAYYEDPGQMLDQSSPDAQENAIVQFRQMPDRVALSSATTRHDHVYSLEPAQRSTRHQQVRLQNEAPSIITGSLTHEMNTDGDGGPGAYEDVVDILRNINQSEERQAAAVDDGVHMQTPAFNVGTDGTIYTQVQLGRGRGGSMSPTTPQPRTIQPLFNTSVYAPIDHTTRIVPLPPTRRH